MDSHIPLGRAVKQPAHYVPEILAGIPRELARSKSGIKVDFLNGLDRWTAYEFVWRDEEQRLHPSVLEIEIGCDSKNIVESKSLKLYLNSCYYRVFTGPEEVLTTLQKDIGDCVLSHVTLSLVSVDKAEEVFATTEPLGECIDSAPMIERTNKNNTVLAVESGNSVHERIYTQTFRSLCPVTSQPDWASVLIEYRGAKLVRSNLLSYLQSYAEHDGFHENCAELIYTDLLTVPEIEQVAVCAKFLRRGGIDICPFRTSTPDFIEPRGRLIRQ